MAIRMNVTRTVFMAQYGENTLCSANYRVLLMMPAAYRLWGKKRLRHLQQWVGEWPTPEMFAGVALQGAEDAARLAASEAELCTLASTEFSGGAADI